MKTEPTFTATIYVGTRRKYDNETKPLSLAQAILQEYVDEVGLCVTLTSTEYIYSKGNEPGFAIGLINYPRFPSTAEQIRAHALKIAHALLLAYEQFKVTVVFPDETVMIEYSDSGGVTGGTLTITE